MFSNSPDRVHFVFADPGDTYYGNDLLALNLNQYLWMKLHRDGYRAVYFLSKNKGSAGNTFSVRTFGDTEQKEIPGGVLVMLGLKRADSISAKNFMLCMNTWLKEKAAVVCPLDDFCDVLEETGWEDAFDSEKKAGRSANCQGILLLTASIYAENNERFLLDSRAFSERRLNFEPILQLRKANRQGMYECFAQILGNGCTMLFQPTADRLAPILTRVLMEHPERMDDIPDLSALARTLEWYLRDPSGQAETDMKKLEELGTPFHHAPFRKIYDCLSNEDTWNALLEQHQKVQKRPNSAGMPRFFSMILRTPSSYAERCLSLRVPEDSKADPKLIQEAQTRIQSIRKKASSPQNRLENKTLIQEIKVFLSDVPKARSKRDIETYCRILYAIDICLQWIDIDSEEAREQYDALCSVIESMKHWIDLSGQYFDSRQEQARSLQSTNDWAAYQKGANLVTKLKLELSRKALDLYEERIPPIVSKLSFQNSLDSINALTRDLNERLDGLQKINSAASQTETITSKQENPPKQTQTEKSKELEQKIAEQAEPKDKQKKYSIRHCNWDS